jgi:ADP-ribosyl-[dinitrogen reductase] hydrolase
VLNSTIAGLLDGDDQPLNRALDLADGAPEDVEDAVTVIKEILAGDADQENVDLKNSGYVVTTLQSGLYHGLTGETAETAIIDAVMMGGDTDTIAAVTGAVAGARFGADALPDRWLEEIRETDALNELGGRLLIVNLKLQMM